MLVVRMRRGPRGWGDDDDYKNIRGNRRGLFVYRKVGRWGGGVLDQDVMIILLYDIMRGCSCLVIMMSAFLL